MRMLYSTASLLYVNEGSASSHLIILC